MEDNDKILSAAEEMKENSLLEVKQQYNLKENNTPSITQSQFATKMEDVKIDVLKNASLEDTKFTDTIKNNLKKAAAKHTEVEVKKADLTIQKVEKESKEVTREQKKTEQSIAEDKWSNRQKFRQYVYDGVKPIMEFVGIKTPFSVILMCLFTLLLIIPFFIAKLYNGTIGLLISGACDKDRSKTVKATLWTILLLIVILGLFVAIYLFLKSQGIDILAKLK